MTYPPQGHPGFPPPGPGPRTPGQGFPQPGHGPRTPQPAFPPPDPPEPSPGGTTPGGRVVIGVVVAAVIGLVVIAVATWGTNARAADVGDCLKVVSTADGEADQVECTAPEAVYQVAKKLGDPSGQCPAGDYTEWTGGKRTDAVKLCLMLNAREGDCFRTTSSGGNKTDERVACGSSADIKVLKVVTGTADKSACTRADIVATYSEPATTLCLTKP